MKRLYNRPDRVVVELLEGLVALHPGLRKLPNQTVIVRSDWDDLADQVALISGGGSGHEPAHAGYVGPGMLTAAVAGDVFTSPPPDAVFAAIQAVARLSGVLLIVKNYTGDRLNFGLAAEMARAAGIAVEVVIVGDDVATLAANSGQTAGPRGLAGTILVHKVAGAAAESGASLIEVAAEARAAAAEVATMGVALTACTVPIAGKVGFTLEDDEVELGLGIHGEPGVQRAPIESADALVGRLVTAIRAARPQGANRMALLVNGLGGTTPMELAIVARSALAHLEKEGITVERAYAGTFLSALEMGGVSLSILGLDDARLARLDAPTLAPAWPNAAPRTRVPWPGPETSPPRSDLSRTTPIEPETQFGKQLRAKRARAAHALIADAARLTELDQAVGDGDLGISLARGAKAVLAALPTWPVDAPAATFRALANLLQKSLGGTSGPLYAVACLRVATAWDRQAASVPNEATVSASTWRQAFRAAIDGIEELGGAGVGDRTMIDALEPACIAFASALDAGQSLPEATLAAAHAAFAGARATASLPPRRGRSSYLGVRALGHPDPGAEAVATWLLAIAEAE